MLYLYGYVICGFWNVLSSPTVIADQYVKTQLEQNPGPVVTEEGVRSCSVRQNRFGWYPYILETNKQSKMAQRFLHSPEVQWIVWKMRFWRAALIYNSKYNKQCTDI